jgi:hypothetical protein
MKPHERGTSEGDERRTGGAMPSFAPGSNVLVRGPSLVGKRALALARFAAATPDERPVALSASRDAAGFRERLALASSAAVASQCYVVDAVRSQVAGGTLACTDGGGDPRTWYVTSPGDLTGTGMSATRAMQAAVTDGGRPRLLVDSISTLLQYNSLERLYRFLHVITGRTSNVGGITIQIVHSDAHTERETATLGQLFDAVVDVVLTDEGTAVRVRGSTAPGVQHFDMADLHSPRSGCSV